MILLPAAHAAVAVVLLASVLRRKVIKFRTDHDVLVTLELWKSIVTRVAKDLVTGFSASRDEWKSEADTIAVDYRSSDIADVMSNLPGCQTFLGEVKLGRQPGDGAKPLK